MNRIADIADSLLKLPEIKPVKSIQNVNGVLIFDCCMIRPGIRSSTKGQD